MVGGESGAGGRHMAGEWARDVRDQCRAAEVPLFVKQMSRREPIPDDLLIREFPPAPMVTRSCQES
jgi:protein gp37